MEWFVAMYLLFAKYPLHFLDIGIEVGVIGGSTGCGRTLYVRQSFSSPHVLKSEKTLSQDSQKGRSERPQSTITLVKGWLG